MSTIPTPTPDQGAPAPWNPPAFAGATLASGNDAQATVTPVPGQLTVEDEISALRAQLAELEGHADPAEAPPTPADESPRDIAVDEAGVTFAPNIAAR